MSFLFLATMLGLSIWVIILFLPFQSYRVNESLETEITKENLDDVTVLIPARNEAQTIKKTLASLKMQHNDLKVILVDDQSTDSTVKEHSTFIYKVSENDKQIAIMQVRQQNIQADIIEIKKDSRELKELSHKILKHLEK